MSQIQPEPRALAVASGGDPSGRRAFRVAIGWFLGIVCIAYLPMFFGQIIFFRDAALWNYPARWFFRESILRGDFPSWNPHQGLGISVFGSPLYGLFYPPNWLFLLVPESLVASMATWQSFAHVVWGSAGVMVLSSRLGASRVGVCVAGLAWGLSGFTTSMWSAGVLLLAGAWVPWCAVGFLSLARSLTSRQPAAWPGGLWRAALPIGMTILMGEIFVAIMGVAFGVLTVLAAVVAVRPPDAGSEPTPAAPRWRWVVAFGLAVALGVGMGAITILPARAIVGATQRAAPLAREVAEVFSLHPLRLVELVAPGSMGQPYGDYPGGKWVGNPLLADLPLAFSVYLGASVVALVLAAQGRGRRLAAVLTGLALTALVVTMGKHTPVHNWLRTIVRPLSYMRYPEKYFVLVVAWTSVVAGLGATRLLSVGERSPGRRVLVLLGLQLALALSAGLLFPREIGREVQVGAIRGLIGLLVLAAAVFVVRRAPRAAATLVVGCVAVDLAIPTWSLQGFGPRRVATDVPEAAAAIVRDYNAERERLTVPRLYRHDKVDKSVNRFLLRKTVPEGQYRAMQTLIPNAVNTFGIATLPGYDAAIPTVLPQLWSSGAKTGQAVMRLLGIRYTLLPIEDPRDPVEHRQGIQPMMDPLPGSRLYRVPDALPRVFVTGRAEVAPDAEVLKRLFDPAPVEGQMVFLAPGDGVAALDAPFGRPGGCRLEAYANSRLVARCRAERAAIAVFIEQFDVGWRAEVDGKPAPLLRANLLCRAVRLEPGDHTVVLSYAPPAVRGAATASVFSLVVLAVLGGLGFARTRKKP